MNPSIRSARALTIGSLTAAILSTLATAALAVGPTTTLGTRGSISQPNPAITANASGAWKDYDRAAQYPRIVTLPLQFITMPSGKKLAVLVTVPADASGKPVA
ncbi:MAG: hypothetical protein EOP40_10680, partial [Rubrivivax sp.]